MIAEKTNTWVSILSRDLLKKMLNWAAVSFGGISAITYFISTLLPDQSRFVRTISVASGAATLLAFILIEFVCRPMDATDAKKELDAVKRDSAKAIKSSDEAIEQTWRLKYPEIPRQLTIEQAVKLKTILPKYPGQKFCIYYLATPDEPKKFAEFLIQELWFHRWEARGIEPLNPLPLLGTPVGLLVALNVNDLHPSETEKTDAEFARFRAASNELANILAGGMF